MSPLSSTAKYRQIRNKKLIRLTAVVLLIMTILSSIGSLPSSAASSFSISSSTLSATDVAADGKIVMNIKVSGQSSTYQYAYWYHKEGASNWYRLTSDSWVSSSSYTFYPSRYSSIMNDTNSRWVIRLAAKNSSGEQASKTFYITVGQPKIVIDSFTAPDLTIGKKITLKTTLSDKVNGFTYQYKYTYVDSAGKETTITDYQNNASYDWSTSLNHGNIPENTNCTLKVYVKEKNNKAKQVTKTTTIKTTRPTYPDVNISSFSVSKAGDYVGDKITLKASVSSGTSPFSYKYSYDDKDGKEQTIKDYTQNQTSTTWDTSKLSAGDYTVRVTVKDKNNKTASKTATVTLKSRSVKASVATIEKSCTQNDPWTPNVRFQVNISDESSAPKPYKFKVQYKKSNDKDYKDISDFREYSGGVLLETLSTSIDVAVYNYRLIVQDNKDNKYTINGESTFEIKYDPIMFSFNASTKEFFTGGGDQKTALSVTDVKGGNGKDIQYKFEYVKYADLTTASPKLDAANVTWTTLKDWSEESNAELLVDKQENAGYYAVRVSVQNKDNTDNKKVVSKTIDGIRVKKPVEVSLTDINDLITKIDTWISNSLTDKQFDTIYDWENENSCLEIYDFRFSEFKAVYDIAKDAANYDKSTYGIIYQKLDQEFTKLKDFYKSDEFRSYNPGGDSGTDWTQPMEICNYLFDVCIEFLQQIINFLGMLTGRNTASVAMFAGFDYNQIAQDIYPIFKTIGYSLIVLLVGVNAIESAFQYELMTLRGGMKICIRLLFAKIFVDLSITICQYIVKIGTEWTNDILSVTQEILNNLQLTLTGPAASGLWIVGWIVDFFSGLSFVTVIGPIMITLVVAAFLVILKLFVRSFELAMLQCVAPPFFACLCGETTKEYFKKFLMSYISVVLDIVFMALIFYIYCQYLNGVITDIDISKPDEILQFSSGYFSFYVVSIGALILMIKTPKVLKNLIAS